jgi:hypothetical protein
MDFFDQKTLKKYTDLIYTSLFDFKPDFTSPIEYYEDIVVNTDNLIDSDKEASKMPHYGSNELNFFNFGYCITGHSSQGSEYDKVALWHDIPRVNMEKNIIARWYYTVITRAKKKLVIIG